MLRVWHCWQFIAERHIIVTHIETHSILTLLAVTQCHNKRIDVFLHPALLRARHVVGYMLLRRVGTDKL